MLTGYLTTAWRAVQKDRRHFLLNLTGFAIGLAAAMLMALYAHHELSYDRQHPDGQRVYRASTDHTARGLQVTGVSSFDVATTFAGHSQVEAIFKLRDMQDLARRAPELTNLVAVQGNYHRLRNFYAATDNVLDFVRLPMLDGDIRQVLSRPGLLALSRTEAIRLFGSVDAVGRTLGFEGGQYRIGAVFEDLPDNTHFHFSALTHLPVQYAQRGSGYIYYKLRPGADTAALAQQLTEARHNLRPSGRAQGVKIVLRGLHDLHFNSSGPMEMKPGGSKLTLQICIALSLVLLLIAGINFINLCIAQSARRAREVGVRKALGATRVQLVCQFLTESLLVVSLAAILAFTLVELSLPTFNAVVDRSLSLAYDSEFTWAMVGVIALVGLAAGLYPALFISAFSAKRVLSGDLERGGTAIWIRKLTLCLQGALSVGLIVGAASLYQQMSLVDRLAVGYQKADRLVVKALPTEALYRQDNNRLVDAIGQLSGVVSVTQSNTDLTSDMEYDFQFTWPNGERIAGPQPTVGTGYYAVDALGLTLLAGRDFTPEFSGDWHREDDNGVEHVGVLVSRRMAALAGYSDLSSVVGMTIKEHRYNLTARIVGVIEDIKIGSARQQALPVSLNLGSNRSATGNLVIKTVNANMADLSRRIRQLVQDELHLSDIQITRVSDDYANAHRNERRALEMVSIFSLLAIFLTCLGTFGLASFAILRRQKEVAVRKVLGASRLSIVNLVAREFLLLMAVSVAIAFPLAYWLVGDWLANFNERIEQGLWVYLAAAGVIAAITWLTVASLTFRTASIRPSLILRYE